MICPDGGVPRGRGVRGEDKDCDILLMEIVSMDPNRGIIIPTGPLKN